MRHHHSVWKEGIIAGLLGALAVAAWFLVIDLIKGQALFTPSVLGQIMLLGRATPDTAAVDTTAVLLYTVFHFLAFIIFGMAVTKLVHLSINIPALRFGLLMLFVVFEVFFWGFTYLFFAGTQGLFPRGAILIANTLAAVAMATYLWHRHPSLKRALRHEVLGS
jgi:hypothetical protein